MSENNSEDDLVARNIAIAEQLKQDSLEFLARVPDLPTAFERRTKIITDRLAPDFEARFLPEMLETFYVTAK